MMILFNPIILRMIYIVNNGTSILEKIVDHVKGHGFESNILEVSQLEGHDFSLAKGVILSGGPAHLSQQSQEEREDYLSHFAFVKNIEVPVLGICLGHQIMGLLYGSGIDSGEVIDGHFSVDILEEGHLFSGVESPSVFMQQHSDFVGVPEGFQKMAGSETCHNEAMQCPTRRRYGVQFHPEASGEHGRRLIWNFLDLC